jgi:hypothetical protein
MLRQHLLPAREEPRLERPARPPVHPVGAEVVPPDFPAPLDSQVLRWLVRPEHQVQPRLPPVAHPEAVAADSVDFVQTRSVR